ncbi:MAG TPA: winged helix-turn-helix domain-containing protein [Bryobacteraceae bacterium]|nr:winged helix-turn-helix domain-containing protein [Bryobacteraceae bacterium]
MGQIAFGPFCMDLDGGRLLRDGCALDLRPQAFQALRALIQNCGRHVDYEQMIHQAWDGAFVSRHTVAVTVGEAKRALREYGAWIHYRPKLGYRLEIPIAEELIRKGSHFAQRHTRDGFERALECFQAAVDADSADFRAFQGMAQCYLKLGALGLRPPLDMYPRFLEAHREAAAREGLTAELRADWAHALHIFERRAAEAETELLQAAKDAPLWAPIHGSLFLLYVSTRRFDQAEAALAGACAADPLWPLLLSLEVFLRLCKREFESAVTAGKKAVDLHPYFPLGRFFLGYALQQAGQLCAAIEQFRLAQIMSPDSDRFRTHEATCLARAGKRAQAERILEELEGLRRRDYVDAYNMAVPYFALGRKDRAFHELERACEENSATLFALDVDPKMDPLRRDPRFQRILRRVFCSQEAIAAEG